MFQTPEGRTIASRRSPILSAQRLGFSRGARIVPPRADGCKPWLGAFSFTPKVHPQAFDHQPPEFCGVSAVSITTWNRSDLVVGPHQISVAQLADCRVESGAPIRIGKIRSKLASMQRRGCTVIALNTAVPVAGPLWPPG